MGEKAELLPASVEMAAGSKESPKDETKNTKKINLSHRIVSFAYKAFRQVSVIGAVYFVGYMQWSVAWLLLPMAISIAREQWRIDAERKRNITKMAAKHSEKDIILAKIDDLPSWVFFPDVERAEWLNKIVSQLWPNVNHYTSNILKKKVEPKIAKKLSKLKLNGFQFNRMILGSIAPRIGGVKVYDKNVPRNEIMMDIDLFYAGDCDISFSVSGIRGGIKDLQIHGMLRVVMKPLIDSIPLVGGLQIFFLNNPSIDFNLVGVIDILDMPGFSDVLRRIIVEQIADVMVLPNKLPIKLSNKIPPHDLRMPQPEGILRIHVVEAKDLMKKDITMLGKGKSDPYAVINVGAQEFRTKVIDNNCNPKWDYWCEAVVSFPIGQFLQVALFDKDDNSKDEKLGRCSVEIKTVARQGTLDTWITLEQAKTGMIHLRMTWYQLTSDKTALDAVIAETQLMRVSGMSSALLCLYIDSCKFLPTSPPWSPGLSRLLSSQLRTNARTQSKPDSYLVVSVGKHSENTGVQMRAADPVYDIGYSFLLNDPKSDTLHIAVMDQKTGKELGQFQYNVCHLLEAPGLQTELQPYSLAKSGPHTKIYLAMMLKILKYEKPTPEEENRSSSPEQQQGETLAREGSVKSAKKQDSVETTDHAKLPSNNSPPKSQLPHQKSLEEPFTKEETTTDTLMPPMNKSPPTTPVLQRDLSITSSAGEAGLGRIQLTLRYSVQRQKLVVVVHKISNIPLKDPSSIPDPYVKLYLLPARSKDSKRKTARIGKKNGTSNLQLCYLQYGVLLSNFLKADTQTIYNLWFKNRAIVSKVMKDNCNPIYDETFEYVMSQGEVNSQNLEVTVATQKGFLSGGSPVIGQVIINLSDRDLSQAQTNWFDLLPESSRD